MDADEFVSAIRQSARDSAVSNTIENLQSPLGRRVPDHVKARSEWYKKLSSTEVAYVDSALAMAAHSAVFGILAILDGVRIVDDGSGHFELFHVGKERTLLNDPDKDLLHDVLNAGDIPR